MRQRDFADWAPGRGSLVLVIRYHVTFAAHTELQRLLLESHNVAALTDLAVFDDLKATYAVPRQATASRSAATFIVHWNRKYLRLTRLAAAMVDCADSAEAAQEWANKLLRDGGARRAAGTWPMGTNARSWWTLDLDARRWFLRRHTDCWVMLLAIADHPMPSPPSQLAAIAWANNIVEMRFHVQPLEWRTGPTTGEPGLMALYADMPDEPPTQARPHAHGRDQVDPLGTASEWRSRPPRASAPLSLTLGVPSAGPCTAPADGRDG